MIQLCNADYGVHYIYDYYPVRNRWTREQREISKTIIDYKNCVESALNRFTDELAYVIFDICSRFGAMNVGLVAVPPSSVDSESPIRKSIQMITTLDRYKKLKEECNVNKYFYDYSGLLFRIQDIRSAHMSSVRPTYQEQW